MATTTKKKPVTPKPKVPYSCPLLMSQEDVRAFRDAGVNIAEIATLMREVKEMTVDNHHTLRGHNGDAGLVAEFATLVQRVGEMSATLETLKNLPTELEMVKGKVEALHDVPAAIDTWKRYPSLTYMIRHNFKEMAIITAAAVVATIAFGFPDPTRGEQIRNLIELLFAKWLRL